MKPGRLRGEFIWHKLDHEAKLFLVVRGWFRIEFRDGEVWLVEGGVAAVGWSQVEQAAEMADNDRRRFR